MINPPCINELSLCGFLLALGNVLPHHQLVQLMFGNNLHNFRNVDYLFSYRVSSLLSRIFRAKYGKRKL
jgi:hypothetical protein